MKGDAILRDATEADFPVDEASAIVARLPHGWFVAGQFGPSGWLLEHHRARARIIISVGLAPDDQLWIHASIANERRLPSYDELVALHRAVWPAGFSYQCFVPPASHVNIHSRPLHLWGLKDGSPLLPDFGSLGSI